MDTIYIILSQPTPNLCIISVDLILCIRINLMYHYSLLISYVCNHHNYSGFQDHVLTNFHCFGKLIFILLTW